ncbi:Baculoviral IAP repeat-containing protein 2 [Durusdinium trenchii]|uniref:Baculoviral IAP repeat-containing protein 2 n=1 Tax=Durusdinium trenchii TaxID=1381693 RepID=A0ABP0KMR2_9DINO
MKFEHRCLQWLDDGHASLMLDANENQELEELRQEVMARRDSAIVACIVEIVVSAAAMALYDLRRTLLVPLANSVLIILASVGLHGALRLELVKVQAHGIVTTGLLIACLGNFLCEAVTGSLSSRIGAIWCPVGDLWNFRGKEH